MNNIDAIANLIIEDKKKTGYYDRYPIRFLFLNLNHDNQDEIVELVNRIKTNNVAIGSKNDVEIIDISKWLKFEDAWISKTYLFDRINKLSKERDYIVLGFSELIRFYSKTDLESLLMSFMTNVEFTPNPQKSRIYFVCFSLFEKISDELHNNARNESINPIICDGDEFFPRDSILVYYTSSSFERYFNNKIKSTQQWLSLFRAQDVDFSNGIACVSDSLVKLYEIAKPDNFVDIKRIDSYYKLMRYIYNMQIGDILEESFKKDFWQKLFDFAFDNKIFDLSQIVKKYFNVVKIDEYSFVGLFVNADLFGKRLLHLYCLEHADKIANSEYLLNILELSKAKDYNLFEQNIVDEFSVINDLQYFKARQFYYKQLNPIKCSLYYEGLLNSLNKLVNDYFSTKLMCNFDKINISNFSHKSFVAQYVNSEEHFLSLFKSLFVDKLKYIITNHTDKEISLLIYLLQDGLLSIENVSEACPDIKEYLGGQTSKYAKKSYSRFNEYFYNYRFSKLLASPTDKLKEYIDQAGESGFYSWYMQNDLNYSVEESSKVRIDSIVVFDGVGAEYFEYLMYLAKKNKKDVLYYNLCKSYLPSITSINKAKFFGKNVDWVGDFDEQYIHGEFYKSHNSIPIALRIINKMFQEILLKYPGQNILITADHGCTALPKLFPVKKLYNYDSEHEGRCAEIDDKKYLSISNCDDYIKYESDNGAKWLVATKNVSLSDNPKHEAHGGCTREEVLIPYIIVGEKNENRVKHTIKNLTQKVNGLNRNVLVDITPFPQVSPVMIDEMGNISNMQNVADNEWTAELIVVKSQRLKICIGEEEHQIEVEGSMGVSLDEGDGFDD